MSKKLQPIMPGEILLEEFLRPLGVTQSKLAEDIGVPANRISQIINGKREITADTALRLSRYFDIDAEFWINLQTHFNLQTARRELGATIKKEVKLNLAATSAC